MQLVIDQGNSRLKAALFEGNQLLELMTFDNSLQIDAVELISQMESKHPFKERVSHGIYSSVGPSRQDLYLALSDHIQMFKLNPNLPVPISIRYASPETLGNDRLALAVGGCSIYAGENILIIDAGSCITFDFINNQKEYLGGSISPGINMRFKALNTFTSNLPLITEINTPELIGNSTLSSIQSGVINGVKAEVMGIIQQYKLHYPSLITVFTGGDLKYFEKNTKNNIFANPNLVLLGLKEILEYNAKT